MHKIFLNSVPDQTKIHAQLSRFRDFVACTLKNVPHWGFITKGPTVAAEGCSPPLEREIKQFWIAWKNLESFKIVEDPLGPFETSWDNF